MKKPAIIVGNVAKKEKKSTVSRSKILFRITGFPVNWIPDKRFRTVLEKCHLHKRIVENVNVWMVS